MSLTPQLPEQAHKTVVFHCSDLHFGRGFQPLQAEKLLEKIRAARPDAVIVSGDLTMRARSGQFEKARKFLQRIEAPLLVIPGNHDVPLYNLFLRFTRPFSNFVKYTDGLSENPLLLQGVALYGINSVNPWRHQQGLFARQHLRAVSRWLADLPRSTWRVVVTHQHFVAIPGIFRPGAIRDAKTVLGELAQGGTHALLCGHMHFKYIGSTRDFFPGLARPIALVHAGTATSQRLRGHIVQVNNFMALEFHENHFTVTPYDWQNALSDFAAGESTRFEREFFGE